MPTDLPSIMPTNGELIIELQELLKEDKLSMEAAVRLHLKVSYNLLHMMGEATEKRHNIWVEVKEIKKNPSLIYLLRNKTKSFFALIGGSLAFIAILHEIVHRMPDVLDIIK